MSDDRATESPREKSLLYVYDGDWPRRATRVRKQTQSFARNGYRVVLISRNDLRQPRAIETDWMRVLRLPSVRQNWLNRLVNLPFFFNPVWFWSIFRAAAREAVDCIVVRDLPLAPTVIAVGRLLRLPVIYDMAEVYPEFLKDRFSFERATWSDVLVRNPSAAARIERWVLKRVSRTIVVSEESWKRCIAFGVTPDRLALVGNTPDDLEHLLASHPLPCAYGRHPNHFKLLFVGILMWDRGVAEAVQAMPTILKHHPNTLLVVIGGGDETQKIQQAIVESGVQDNVIMLGWREHEELPPFYAHAHIGLLPFMAGNHVRITLANKLFDYMAAGLPIVAADVAPMHRVLDETKAGRTFEAGNSEALAAAVVAMLDDPAQRQRLGENGRRSAITKYNWANDERRLIDAVDAVTVTPARRGSAAEITR